MSRRDPYLFLAAAPTQATSIPTLFRTEGVRQVLQNPPTIRASSMGFDLHTLDRGEIVEGKKLTFSNGERKRIDLYPGGVFVAIGFFPGFLGWPRSHAEFGERPTINALAMAEFTVDFVLTYAAVVDFFDPTPTGFEVRDGIRNAILENGRKLRLPPYQTDSIATQFGEGRDAPAGTFDSETIPVQAPNGQIDVGAVAYELAARIYRWFGHPDEVIPYADHAARRFLLEMIAPQ